MEPSWSNNPLTDAYCDSGFYDWVDTTVDIPDWLSNPQKESRVEDRDKDKDEDLKVPFPIEGEQSGLASDLGERIQELGNYAKFLMDNNRKYFKDKKLTGVDLITLETIQIQVAKAAISNEVRQKLSQKTTMARTSERGSASGLIEAERSGSSSVREASFENLQNMMEIEKQPQVEKRDMSQLEPGKKIHAVSVDSEDDKSCQEEDEEDEKEPEELPVWQSPLDKDLDKSPPSLPETSEAEGEAGEGETQDQNMTVKKEEDIKTDFAEMD